MDWGMVQHRYQLEVQGDPCYECPNSFWLEFKAHPWSPVVESVRWLVANAKNRDGLHDHQPEMKLVDLGEC